MNSLLFLGTGPGSPVAGRFFSSCLLRTDTASVLVDAGEPCSQRLREHGIPVSSLDAVLLTHGHSDHTAGLPMLLQAAWLEKRRRPLPVYLPRELIEPLTAWLRAVYLPGHLLGFPLEFRPWQSGRTEAVAADVSVVPFPTTHLDGLRKIIDPDAKEGFEVFGLDVQCGDRRVVFSSDLGTPRDMLPALSRPVDVLVCELSHYTADELFEDLKNCEISQLVLNHLSPDLAGKEQEIAEMARRALPSIGSIVVLRDGDTVRF